MKEKEEEPDMEELPERLNIRVIKAWKHLTMRLAEEGLLDGQRAEKGNFWRVISNIPNKVKVYKITGDTKNLYELSMEEYKLMRALTNAYGTYQGGIYDESRPLTDTLPSKLEGWVSNLSPA